MGSAENDGSERDRRGGDKTQKPAELGTRVSYIVFALYFVNPPKNKIHYFSFHFLKKTESLALECEEPPPPHSPFRKIRSAIVAKFFEHLISEPCFSNLDI